MERQLPPDELIEIRELEFDFLEELMAEPPGGHNHGRERGENGWRPLETPGVDRPSEKHYVDPRKHGIAYTASKIGCGCDLCREWRRNRKRDQRERARNS